MLCWNYLIIIDFSGLNQIFRTSTSLAKTSLKIKKDSPKVKQVVTKLTKKYCPLANDLARTPKSYEHISSKNTSSDKPSTSSIAHKDKNQQSNKTSIYSPITDNTLTLPHVTPPNRKMSSENSSNCPENTSISFMSYTKGHTNIKQNNGSTTCTVNIEELPSTSNAIVSTLPYGQTQIHLPDNIPGTLSPTTLLEGSTSKASSPKSSTDWERLIMEEYDPDEPPITYISSDEESTDFVYLESIIT